MDELWAERQGAGGVSQHPSPAPLQRAYATPPGIADIAHAAGRGAARPLAAPASPPPPRRTSRTRRPAAGPRPSTQRGSGPSWTRRRAPEPWARGRPRSSGCFGTRRSSTSYAGAPGMAAPPPDGTAAISSICCASMCTTRARGCGPSSGIHCASLFFEWRRRSPALAVGGLARTRAAMARLLVNVDVIPRPLHNRLEHEGAYHPASIPAAARCAAAAPATAAGRGAARPLAAPASPPPPRGLGCPAPRPPHALPFSPLMRWDGAGRALPPSLDS